VQNGAERQSHTAQQAANATHEEAGQFSGGQAGGGSAVSKASQPENATVVRAYPKVGRNDPCPCGSGKKYKYCHGR